MLKTLSLKLLIFIFVLENSVAFATDFSNFTYIDNYAYNFVKSTCHLSMEALATLIESTKNDSREYLFLIDSGLNNEEIHFSGNNIVSRKGIGRNVARLLSSDGYYFALRDCFPNSEFKRNLYTQNLLLLDSLGKFSVISIFASFGYAASKGIGLIGRRVIAVPIVYGFKRAGASKALLAKIPGRTDFATQMTVMAALAFNIKDQALAIRDNISKEKELAITPKQDSAEELKESIAALNENLELYELINKMEDSASDKQKQELLIYKEKQKKNLQYYLAEILNNKQLTAQDRLKYEKLSKKLE